MTSTISSGRLVFHIFGAIAEFERQLIRERTLSWRQLPSKVIVAALSGWLPGRTM